MRHIEPESSGLLTCAIVHLYINRFYIQNRMMFAMMGASIGLKLWHTGATVEPHDRARNSWSSQRRALHQIGENSLKFLLLESGLGFRARKESEERLLSGLTGCMATTIGCYAGAEG